MPKVIFSRSQRRLVNGDEEVEIDAGRVDALIRALYARYPDLAGKLDGVAVSIDGDIHNDARYAALEPDVEVHFVGAIAGGSGTPIDAPPKRGVAIENADPLESARSWRSAGLGVAIATVVETWGSSPCPPGSQLAVNQNGHFEGSVSGGCVEGAVIETATGVIAEGAPALVEFGVADEAAWAVGLACGGRVKVFVERLD